MEACYFKYRIKNEIIEFVAITEKNSKKGEKTVILKGINNFINH